MSSGLTSDGYEVPLIRVRDAASISGLLVPLTTKHLDDFRIVWRERLRTSADEDQYWDWEQKQRIYLAGGMGLYEPTSSRLDRKKVILDKVDLKYHK